MEQTDPLLHLDAVPRFLRDMPKAELHVHIEGTIEGEKVIELADRNGVELPYKSAADVRALQSNSLKNPHNNLANFLHCLDISRSVLKRGEDFYDIAMAFFRRCHAQNVVYLEVMFDPQQAIRGGVSFGEHFEALLQAGRDAEADYGLRVQWIMTMQRDHPVEDALQTLKNADPWRQHIAGVGLDNFETPGFPRMFLPFYAAARERGYRLTSHCDVNQPDSLTHIHDCITLLGVERIDHGLNTALDATLLELVKERRIALTGCPTFMQSQGSPAADRLNMIKALLEAGVRISINTDDPAQFASGYLCHTLAQAQIHAGFSDAQMLRLMENAFCSTWLPGPDKRDYLAALEAHNRKFVTENASRHIDGAENRDP